MLNVLCCSRFTQKHLINHIQVKYLFKLIKHYSLVQDKFKNKNHILNATYDKKQQDRCRHFKKGI